MRRAFNISHNISAKDGFTLIELLVVIAIVAILALVTILVINPAEFFKQARDATRLSDLRNVNTALGYVQVDSPSISLGTASTTYVSIADSVATSSAGTQCQGLSLPALPSGWNYHCAASSTLTNVDGTGWIPVNFTGLSFGAPFSKLPIDPTNTSSSHLYYTYTPGGSWELTSAMEASKNTRGGEQDKSSSDGGLHDGLYEIGTDLALAQTDYGDSSMVGYWRLDNASTTALDASWNRNHGTGQGSITIGGVANQQGIANRATSFDGTDDYIQYPYSSLWDWSATNYTISMWIKNATNTNTGQGPIQLGKKIWNSNAEYWSFGTEGNGHPQFYYWNGAINKVTGDATVSLNTYAHIVMTLKGSTISQYNNGIFDSSASVAGTPQTDSSTGLVIGAIKPGSQFYFNGTISDVRIYNRALSATEISNLYNATKP